MSETNHNPSISEMIDHEDEVRIGLYGRPAELQFVRLAADYNRLKTALAAACERNGNLSVELAAMTAERDQWKALFLNTMGQINNADDRNPMCPCGAIIFEAIQRMPK